MKCLDPILCYTLNGIKIYRHFSKASPIDRQLHTFVFNCRTCPVCRKTSARELAMRCVLHASLSNENSFLTLTYDESKEGYHNNLQYKDIQDFKKRLRSHCLYHFGSRVQVFNVHEYGKNGKKHWHLVVFNHDFPDKEVHTQSNGVKLYTSEKLTELWPYGFNTIGDITEASAMYTAQYAQKDLTYGNVDAKKYHSKHSGIGRDYFLQHYDQILRLGYVPFAGHKLPIPRYFYKLAHKHYSHFYERHNFLDFTDRKKLYTPFKDGQANKHLADLFKVYSEQRQNFIEELAQEWNETIKPFIYTKDKPDFQKSAENYIHDQKNRNLQKTF